VQRRRDQPGPGGGGRRGRRGGRLIWSRQRAAG
jgi:hypothetical protein